MPCFHPLDAWQTQAGEIHFYARGTSGKKGKAPDYRREIKLPCGRCIGCRLERSRQWAVRCMHEAQLHEDNCFVTLTYDDNHLRTKSALPTRLTIAQDARLNRANTAHVNRVDNAQRAVRGGGLSIQDHQRFIKRLRKHIDPRTVRFYGCGEYGEKLGRPHYHYILFGYNFPDRVVRTEREGIRTYTSQILQKLWPYGYSEIGNVTFESCAYVARYVMKKVTGNAADQHYRHTDEAGNDYWIQPEFNVMSRRPGIAHDWFKQYHMDVYSQDAVVLAGGIKMKPPRYYDELLQQLDQQLLEELQMARMDGHRYEDNTPARLAVREQVTKARLALKKRTYEI